MPAETKENKQIEKQKRVLGDEWLDWDDRGAEEEIREGKRTFLVLCVIVMVWFLSFALLSWYLVRPRFELYGRPYFITLTVFLVALASFFLIWFVLLMIAVLSRNTYLNVCLQKGNNLFITLFPFVMKLAAMFGISRDRLSHSFIRVSNRLAVSSPGEGPVLALLPRCLNRDVKKMVKDICAEFPSVIPYTAPGGNVARRIIQENNPRAIVAVACERDLVSGIQDVAPKIPVIGIPNKRPTGPCKDTSVDVEEFRSALKFFCNRS